MAAERRAKVAVARCATYERDDVSRAVGEVLGHLGGMARFVSPGQKVLLKPNLLAAKDPCGNNGRTRNIRQPSQQRHLLLAEPLEETPRLIGLCSACTGRAHLACHTHDGWHGQSHMRHRLLPRLDVALGNARLRGIDAPVVALRNPACATA